jgi:hypothetical protein
MRIGALVLAMIASAAWAADAQTRPSTARRPVPAERVFVSVNGIFQAGSNDFKDSSTFRENAEDGRLDADYAVGSGPAFDVSGGAMIWRNLAVGVGVSRFSRSTPTEISAAVPHPFFFSQPRSVTGQFNGTREEVAVHIQVRGVFPVTSRIQVSIFGGPSYFRVAQSIVDDFTFSEAYPFDTATFSAATAARRSESKMGANVGADVAYFFNPKVGVGGSVQYSGTTVRVAVPSGTKDLKGGAVQFGGGLRLRF